MLWVGLMALLACGTDDETKEVDAAPSGDTGTSSSVASSLGHCTYINAFSQAEECKEYTGPGWTEADAATDCAAPAFPAEPGDFTAGVACPYVDRLGTCTLDEGTDDETVLVFPGTDGELCGGLELGCGFAGGRFEGEGACVGQTGTGSGFGSEPFVPFEEVCVDESTADDGEVCTWNAISGCTEPGNRYEDYGDCDAVLTQRPYVAYDAELQPAADGRLDDPAWAAEFDWFTQEVEACACVCCHDANAPDGPAGWNVDHGGPIWLDTVSDDAMAMFVGWIDSEAFGAFDPAENYGFDRSVTGIPTTDVPRLQAFLRSELERRGRTEADFADEPAWGGPLVDQLAYRPEPCVDGQGLVDGELVWTGGDVRYLYVLEADATTPTVPPNLDLPEGTLWRVDVGLDGTAVSSGVPYGQVPAGATQAWPEGDAQPPPLVSGRSYYLAAFVDIIQPATRCLFQAP